MLLLIRYEDIKCKMRINRRIEMKMWSEYKNFIENNNILSSCNLLYKKQCLYCTCELLHIMHAVSLESDWSENYIHPVYTRCYHANNYTKSEVLNYMYACYWYYLKSRLRFVRPQGLSAQYWFTDFATAILNSSVGNCNRIL